MKKTNYFLLVLLASLWGPSFLFIKIAVEVVPPMTLVALRLSLAAILLSAILFLRGGKLPLNIRSWRKFIFMGLFANTIPFFLFSFGEQFTDSGAASILNGTTPIFTVILAHFFISDERMTPGRFLGVIIGFLGILFIFYPEVLSLFSSRIWVWEDRTIGLLAFVAASTCYGVAIVFGRLYLRGLPPLTGPTAQLISASLFAVPIALWFEKPFDLTLQAPAVLSVMALGIFGTALAYLVYYRLVDSAGATFISLVTYFLPPIGVFLGLIFLAEKPGWYSYIGLVLIIFGVTIVNGFWDKRFQKKKDVIVIG